MELDLFLPSGCSPRSCSCDLFYASRLETKIICLSFALQSCGVLQLRACMPSSRCQQLELQESRACQAGVAQLLHCICESCLRSPTHEEIFLKNAVSGSLRCLVAEYARAGCSKKAAAPGFISAEMISSQNCKDNFLYGL